LCLPDANAATLLVTTSADNVALPPAGSLRAQIAAASPGDTINFNAGMTITLAGGELAIAKNLTIDAGANAVTIDANHGSRVFYTSSGTVNLTNLTITKGLLAGNGGNAGSPGAIGSDSHGGGIYNAGILTITGCTVTANKASGGGGGGGSTGASYYAGGGGGGGGFGTGAGGKGGNGTGSGPSVTGASAVAPSGGKGGEVVPATGGGGGNTSGGAGGSYAGFGTGGAGGSADNGTLRIGGGGGGAGYNANGGNGGAAVGGIYNAAGTLTILNSTITNNIGAGGGGGGTGSTANAGNGGHGVGGIWNAGGTVRLDAASYASFGTTNAGGNGLAGQVSGTGSAGTNGIATGKIYTSSGTTITNYAPPPTIGGVTAGQAVTDKTTVSPFSATTIADSSGNNVTVTVTLDVQAKGSFTTLSGFTDNGNGSYTLTNVTAAAAQSAIHGLVFTPAANRVNPPLTETTTLTVLATDVTTSANTSNATTTVISTSVNDAPILGGATAVTPISDKATATPFSGFTIADADAAQTLTMTVALDTAARGALSNLGGGTYDGFTGIYSFTGTAAQAQVAIRALVFTPTANRVSVSSTETTTFAVSVNDGIASTVTNNATTVVTTSVNDAPTIGGVTAVTNVNDNATVTPFSAVTIADVDPAQTQTLTVTLDTAAKGALSNLSTGNYTAGTGVYIFTGTAVQAQVAIRGLVFTPIANRVAVGATETTTFTISVNDGVATAVTNSATTVVSTSVNDAPTIGGVTAVTNILDTATATPFSTVTIVDPDTPAQTQTVSVTLDVAAKGSFTTLNGFSNGGGGVYTFNGTAAATQTAIRGLVFTPTANRVNPGLTETTTFTISVNDGVASAVTNNATTVVTTSVNDAPTIGGVTAVTNILDTATATPFSTLTIADADSAQTQAVSVTLDVAAKGSFTTLNGFSNGGAGVYNFSGTAAAAAQTAIRGLVFTPTANRVNPGLTETTRFTVSFDDGVATAVTNNATTVVTNSVNDAPTIGGVTAVTNILDTATATPFSVFTIADPDIAQTQTVSVTLDTAAKGSFTTLNGFSNGGGGIYNFSGTAAAAQTAIRGLVFKPTANRLAPTLTETTTFTVSVSDGIATAATNSATTVVSTSVNDVPTFIGATSLNLPQSAPATEIKSLLHVSDSDIGQTETWSQSVAPLHGTLNFVGTTAASGSADITPGGTITYAPTPGYSGTDTFTVQVSDGLATATRVITVSVASNPVNGACGSDQGMTLTSTPTNLCSAGTPGAVSASNILYSWDCAGVNGGGNTSCSATRNYLVTTSVTGGNGSIGASQNVAYNATPKFTLKSNGRYAPGPITGTCGGARTGYSYTTNAITAACTVIASFVPDTVRNALFVNASTSDSKTSLIRLTNTGDQSGTLTATAYNEAGNAVGMPNAVLGQIAGQQIRTFSSSQLEAALGFTPSAPTAKYRVAFDAGLKDLELINLIVDSGTGNLGLGQAQTDNRPSDGANFSTRNMLFANASVSGNKTSVVRLINPGDQSGTVYATAYGENGEMLGIGYSPLGTLGARQMLTFTSAQLEAAIGAAPSMSNGKYRVVFSAAIPSFELINFVQDRYTGGLTLGQSQIDNRTAGVTGSSSRNALAVLSSSSATGKTSVLRVVNLGENSAALSASAYNEAGDAIGTANASLGMLAAGQMLTFTSSQLEALIGYSAAASGRYRIVFNAALPSFEVINFVRETGTGNLSLAQAQIDNRGSATTTSSTRTVLFETASTNPRRTSEVRLINLGNQSGAITATAYDAAGKLVGTANAVIGPIGAQQTLSFTSAQLQTAIGFAPPTGLEKYHIVFHANLPSFEVINYILDRGTGNLTLGQGQVD
jgi:hypothetical protein